MARVLCRMAVTIKVLKYINLYTKLRQFGRISGNSAGAPVSDKASEITGDGDKLTGDLRTKIQTELPENLQPEFQHWYTQRLTWINFIVGAHHCRIQKLSKKHWPITVLI